MRLNTILFGPTERTTFFFRLLVVCLSALAFLPFSPKADVETVLIWGGYLALGGLLLVRRRPLGSRLALIVAAADVGAVTLLSLSAPQGAPLLWPLYIFSLAAAALAGAPAVAAAAVLSAASWLALTLANHGDWFQAAWPVALLIASASSVLLISGRWAVERRQRHVWQEAAARAPMLWLGDDPGAVAASIMDAMVKLGGAGHGWLLRRDVDGRAFPVAKSARVPETALPGDTVMTTLGNASAVALTGDKWAEVLGGPIGEAIALRSESSLAGVVILVWDKLPGDAVARMTAVRSLSTGGAEALRAADGVATLREELGLQTAFGAAAREAASTLDSSAMTKLVAEIIESTLGARVSIESGEELAGGDHGERLAVPLGKRPRVMLVTREGKALSTRETEWLREVGSVLETGLARCEEHSALMAEEQRFRAALDRLPAPALLTRSDGTLVLTNRAYRSVWGSARAPVSASNRTPEVEEEVVAGDPPRTFGVTSAPIGHSGYSVTLFREITREREALRVKDELIAMAGHELRSPLTSISGYSQMMAKQLGVVQRQIAQLDQLIGDFMEASSFDDAHLSLEVEPLDVGELARVAAERFVGSHPSRPLRLEIDEALEIEGDPTRLGQVLDNLLSNANKYSPREDAEIVLGTAANGDHVLMWVRDHGCGIEPEHLPLLFERFYRVQSSETQGVKGLGLGLSLVRDLVVAHGGRVWAESAGNGQGSTFWVELPASRNRVEAA